VCVLTFADAASVVINAPAFVGRRAQEHALRHPDVRKRGAIPVRVGSLTIQHP
jgi:hypothetical protein